MGADLEEANLMGTNLERANLSGANLKGAFLTEANLKGTNLMAANLTHCKMSDVDYVKRLWYWPFNKKKCTNFLYANAAEYFPDAVS